MEHAEPSSSAAWLLTVPLLIFGLMLALPIIGIMGVATGDPPIGLVQSIGPPFIFQPPPGSQWIWPLNGPITTGFGYEEDPFGRGRMFHTGVDIAAPAGTPIRAAGAGVVVQAGWSGNYGELVVIDHGNGVQTWYGHQSGLAVRKGEQVAADDIIGWEGSTGLSTGPHLHFEVRLRGEPVDPLAFYGR